jgi:hypothetical protein
VTLSGNYNVNSDGVTSPGDPDGDGTLLIIDLPRGVYRGKSVTIKLRE